MTRRLLFHSCLATTEQSARLHRPQFPQFAAFVSKGCFAFHFRSELFEKKFAAVELLSSVQPVVPLQSYDLQAQFGSLKRYVVGSAATGAGEACEIDRPDLLCRLLVGLDALGRGVVAVVEVQPNRSLAGLLGQVSPALSLCLVPRRVGLELEAVAVAALANRENESNASFEVSSSGKLVYNLNHYLLAGQKIFRDWNVHFIAPFCWVAPTINKQVTKLNNRESTNTGSWSRLCAVREVPD